MRRHWGKSIASPKSGKKRAGKWPCSNVAGAASFRQGGIGGGGNKSLGKKGMEAPPWGGGGHHPTKEYKGAIGNPRKNEEEARQKLFERPRTQENAIAFTKPQGGDKKGDFVFAGRGGGTS